MMTSAELIEAVKEYEPTVDEDMLKKAYIFAMDVHGLQKRASGTPYFSHPVEVAKILADMKLDSETVITGLLHDVVEDTTTTIEDIREEFNDSIAKLVSGVTKLNKVTYSSAKEHQADNFRKFLMSISEDIRVLIVKLADRLHNMRTLNAIKDREKRKKIAIETMDVYAPLAERIGMQAIKDELDDRAFFTLYPDEYNAILFKLNQIRHKDADFIKNITNTLNSCLQQNGIDATVSGREKRPCSIWRKICNHNVTLDQLNDIIAFRIIVNTVEDCYRALGIVHTKFPILPGRFKDYISIPKLNNYRSLHTTVLGPFQQKVEIQIRTQEMHYNAENGVAAHWSYKDGNVDPAPTDSTYKKWLKSLVAVLEATNNPDDVIDNSKLEMRENNIFCFTPTGELISLPAGATCVDFAYAIHTSVGDTCVGAKVNGRVVPLKTILQNGDQIEILTSRYQKPDVLWNKFVITNKAKSGIRQFVKKQGKIEFAKLGQIITRRVFEKLGVVFQESKIPITRFGCDNLSVFYRKVAKSEISIQQMTKMFSTLDVTREPCQSSFCISGLIPGIAIHYADCCKPISGDSVYGILLPQKGLMVHTASCEVINRKMNNAIPLQWEQDGSKIDDSFVARLKIALLNKPGSLAQLTQVISSRGANITNLRFESREHDFYDIFVDIEVQNIFHLGEIQAAISTCSRVRTTRRV